ncbi:histidine phosphatase family protein [Stieleria sp. JC731]|uniref:SixA phosphatase family protein n=1 Tax=Pirellulaceae TaxID=2691357 RepID=UPI001E5B9651|nr:histidine phosphatase family protein [Stieleria sp. JC731]MCC9604196.1 histidine phosphatase family protein [Stieleria sp. JC731]
MDSRLILMRHAKSDHGDPTISDHQRPLNRRGRGDSPRMAQWLAAENLTPDIVLSSTSQRTRETLELMLPLFETEPEIRFCDSLYLSSPESILWTISTEHCGKSRVLVLGHNPGMSMVSSVLSGKVIEMPTAAIAVLSPQRPRSQTPPTQHWLDEINPRTACELASYMYPKGLDCQGETTD